MDFNLLFGIELLLVVLLAVGAIIGVVRLTAQNRRGAQDGRGTPANGARADRAPETSTPRQPTREFYKRTSLENDEDMKMRLYSLDEYRSELGGDPEAHGGGRFVAALKAYQPVGDEWYDLPADRAAPLLDLSPGEYEVDEERGVLLLRKLPRGLPTEARDVI